MILVTGGAGFIGSNVVHALNARGERDLIVVDDLTDGRKFRNLVGAALADYVDRDDFAALLDRDDAILRSIHAILHQGACSDTTEWDGRYMLRNNYTGSRRLLAFAQERRIPFVYASSAAVYGGGTRFVEDEACEGPLNVYGYSKWLFDQHVRRVLPAAESPIVGLRYFNVYGPRESHKGAMASVAWHFDRQLRETGRVALFEGTDGYADGEQRRDFVYVDDVAAVNLWFLDHAEVSGIFNVGTGRSEPFNAVARAVLAHHGRGEIAYVPFPEKLRGSYQSFTEADLGRLRSTGCDVAFRPVADGVSAYLRAIA